MRCRTKIPDMLLPFLRSLVSAFKIRRSLALENLALRQQLAVLRSSVKRPCLSDAERGFWVLLSRVCKDWTHALVLVKPETVLRWHRKGFRSYWTWKGIVNLSDNFDKKGRIRVRKAPYAVVSCLSKTSKPGEISSS